MANKLRWLGAMGSLLVLGCGGSSSDNNGNAVQSGGGSSTGGASTTLSSPSTGGTRASHSDSLPSGGTRPTGGAASSLTTTSGAGGSPTGGASAGGASATSGTVATGGSSSSGGTPGTGGQSSTAPDPFCTVLSSDLPLSGICTTGCSAGGVTLTGSSSGLAITGKIFSETPLFFGNPVPNNIEGGKCAGFSAADPQSHTNYTGVQISVTNSMSTPQEVTLMLLDMTGGTLSVPTTCELSAAIPVPANTTVTQTLKWGIAGSQCGGAAHCAEFVSECDADAGSTFDPTRLLKLGLAVGSASTSYPIENVNISINSITFQ